MIRPVAGQSAQVENKRRTRANRLRVCILRPSSVHEPDRLFGESARICGWYVRVCSKRARHSAMNLLNFVFNILIDCGFIESMIIQLRLQFGQDLFCAVSHFSTDCGVSQSAGDQLQSLPPATPTPPQSRPTATIAKPWHLPASHRKRRCLP